MLKVERDWPSVSVGGDRWREGGKVSKRVMYGDNIVGCSISLRVRIVCAVVCARLLEDRGEFVKVVVFICVFFTGGVGDGGTQNFPEARLANDFAVDFAQ
jgi:hypothetical protein